MIRDVSFLPREYQSEAQKLSDEQYRELLFGYCSHLPCLCGNSSPGGNFWMENQQDNCVKILEDDR